MAIIKFMKTTFPTIKMTNHRSHAKILKSLVPSMIVDVSVSPTAWRNTIKKVAASDTPL